MNTALKNEGILSSWGNLFEEDTFSSSTLTWLLLKVAILGKPLLRMMFPSDGPHGGAMEGTGVMG